MNIEIYQEVEHVEPGQIDLVQNLLQYAGEYLELPADTEVSVTLVDNDRIQEMNRHYRFKDYATDVLSFASSETVDGEEDIFQGIEDLGLPLELGDLFVSIEKMEDQAEEFGHSTNRELGFLVVHGFLHLNGYDHQTDQEEAEMNAIQEEILQGFGLVR